MTHEVEMYLHYYMTANNLVIEASKNNDKITKLDLLNEATRNLNEAERSGAPKETLKELRCLIADKFIEITKGNSYDS